MKTEFEFIQWLRTRAGNAPANLIAGIGDDAAIFSPASDRELLVTTDLLVEGIHFNLEYTPPSLLGNKALAVNLSDIAAMGGRPNYFLLNIARPRTMADNQLEAIVTGMLSLAEERSITLIGGDTSASKDRLFISITVIGECERGKAIKRSTAKPGDKICVSGSLGGAALGLELLKAGKRLKDMRSEIENTGALRNYLTETVPLRAHLAPQPRLALGATIGARALATAMIDISDGLSSDLGHICKESGVGAEIYAQAIPVTVGASLEQALNGGEDYELLFTVAPERESDLEVLRKEFSTTEITVIGTITAGSDRWIIKDEIKKPLLSRGFDHFENF